MTIPSIHQFYTSQPLQWFIQLKILHKVWDSKVHLVANDDQIADDSTNSEHHLPVPSIQAEHTRKRSMKIPKPFP